MHTEHEVARKRKLLGDSSEADVETDEQLARRLHEELNALTRHSRRAAAAPSGPSTQKKTGKAVSAQDDKQATKQHRGSDAAKQSSLAAVKQEAVGAREQQTGSDREDKARKRCMLNRELAMLVVDMVESQVKPVNGPRSKLKGEQQQDNHSVAVKHESSSSLSEQERLAIEHLHAAGADGKLVNKLLLGSHLLARTSDSGAAADSSTTGATSSGKGSGLEQEQQQSVGQQQQQQAQQQLQRVNTVNSSAAASTRVANAADCGGSRPIRIPKLPMVQYGKEWYRAKVLKDAGSKVMLEYQGYNHEGGPFWLNKDHARIWRGSYKGKDWRYLGDGAWEPKVPMTQEPKPRSRCRIQRKHSTATGTASDVTAPEDSDAEEEEEEEVEEEQQQQRQQRRQPCRGRAAGKTTASVGDAAADSPGHSGHDTSSTDQEGEGEAGSPEQQQQQQQQEPGQKQQPAEVLTVDSPAMPESVQQPAVAVATQTAVGQQGPQRDADLEQQHEQLFEQQQQQEGEQEQGREVIEALNDEAQEVKFGVANQALPYVHQEHQDNEQQQQQLDAEHQQQADVKQNKSQQRAESKGKPSGRQPQQSKQQSQSEPKQSESKQQTSRRRRQSDADASDAGGQKAAASDSPLIKQSRRQASARAAEKAAERAAAAATAERLAAAEKEAAAVAAAAKAAAAAAPAPAADSSSERQAGDAAPASKAEQTEEKEEVLSTRTKSTSRGGRTRGGRHNGKSAPPAAATVEAQPSAKRARGGRNKPGVAATAPATAAASDVSGKEQQPPSQALQQASVSNALQVDAGRVLKHSSSSEGMPLSPTSPTAGGSPRMTGHRRKGKPQRARLDSDDLQQPAKKIKLGSSTSKSNGLAWAYSNSDAADILEMSFEQAPPPQPKAEPEPQQQQQQAQEQKQMHLGWKGGWKGAYKKGMWQQQQGKEVKQRDHAQSQYHKQQHEVMVVQQPWCEQQELQEIHPGAAPVAVGEDFVPTEQQQQQPVLGGSDPDDVEAACVLVGASVGRTHSTEVYNTFDMQQQTYQQQQHAFMSEEQPLSPRAYQAAAAAHANSRQNGRRRGHNWSKPLSRPPRPPTLQQPQQQQQRGFIAARQHSSNGSLQHGMYASGDLCNQQAQGAVQEALYTGAVAPSPRFSRQPSLQGCSSGVLPQIPAVLHGQHQQQQLQRDGSYQLCNGEANGKPATLRALLDAVGEVQANSGRPDLMYPLQYGGLPTASDVAKPAGLHLPHVQVSAAAAALLAAVPSLETLQHMASARGQAGPLVACLSGDSSLSLFH